MRNAVTAIDLWAIRFLNSYAGVSHRFDAFMVSIAYNGLFKAGPLLVAFWALWFARDPLRQQYRRARIISALAAACFAAAVSVGVTHVLPLRRRPLIEPQLDFVLPFGMGAEGWDRISSLPSDHAAMFFALAIGMCVVSRRWGSLAVLHVLLFIFLPRAYLGLHYVTDLAAGALIGLVFVWICNARWFLTSVSQRLLALEAVRPAIFYPAMFLISAGILDLFHESRGLLGLVTHTLTGQW
ncbi:MAG TPA: phosphatase PAP2 family protein [Variovorax sp.]